MFSGARQTHSNAKVRARAHEFLCVCVCMRLCACACACVLRAWHACVWGSCVGLHSCVPLDLCVVCGARAHVRVSVCAHMLTIILLRHALLHEVGSMHAHAGSTMHDKLAQARRTATATSGSCRSTPAGTKLVCDQPAWALATSKEWETDALSSAQQRGVSLLCRHTHAWTRMHTPAFVRVARERIRVCGCLLLSLHAYVRAPVCVGCQ